MGILDGTSTGSPENNQQAGSTGVTGGDNSNDSGTTAQWYDSLPEDLRGNASLKQFKDVGSLAKSYVHAQSLMGRKGVLPPTDKSSEDDWNKFYTDIGRPELDKYEVATPKDKKVHEETLKEFKETAFKNGMLPKQASAMYEWLISKEEGTLKSIQENKAKSYDEGVSSLQKEWGTGFEKQVQLARSAVNDIGGEGLIKRLVELGVDSDPTLVKAFAKAAQYMSEDRLRGAGLNTMGTTPEQLKREIDEIMSNPAYSDKAHGDYKKLNNKASDLFKELYK